MSNWSVKAGQEPDTFWVIHGGLRYCRADTQEEAEEIVERLEKIEKIHSDLEDYIEMKLEQLSEDELELWRSHYGNCLDLPHPFR